MGGRVSEKLPIELQSTSFGTMQPGVAGQDINSFSSSKFFWFLLLFLRLINIQNEVPP